MSRRRLTAEQQAAIIEDFKLPISVAAIAEKHGVSASYPGQLAKRLCPEAFVERYRAIRQLNEAPTAADHAREVARKCGQLADAFMRARDFHRARFQIERAHAWMLLALDIEQKSPAPGSASPVVAAEGVKAAAPAGADGPSNDIGPAGSLIDLPEEVPFQ